VSSHHQQKIYLNQEYPCPCHPSGKLQQIVLTEAFGCDQCHRIFVMKEDCLTIEELSSVYPYKRRYYWNGKRFQILRSFPTTTVWVLLRSRDIWALWLQCLGIIALVISIFRLYFRVTLTSQISNLILSMAIAIVVIIVITLWLFDQG
jgi:hypothetical protein